MRRYLNMDRVPTAPYGHRVVEAGVWADGRACEQDQTHGVATHITQSREERGRRRSSVVTVEQWVCAECAREWAATHRVELPPSAESLSYGVRCPQCGAWEVACTCPDA